MGTLKGKVAVMTGSTSGIGARAAELGARVVIARRCEERGRQTAHSAELAG